MMDEQTICFINHALPNWYASKKNLVCVCACVRACVPACVRACVRACVVVYECVGVPP